VVIYIERRACWAHERAYEASDMRDKVFVLLGMTSDAEDFAMYVDYNQPSSQVFERVSRHLLDRDQDVIILYHAKSTGEDNPSWVSPWATDVYLIGLSR
jgi:hypothetical protein